MNTPETSKSKLRVAFGTDHGGWPLRQPVIETIAKLGCELLDLGPAEVDPGDDYPDCAAAVGRAVSDGRADRGVLLCGSGVGVVLAANRFREVRACLCHDSFSAAQGVRDDDMNVLCLGGRVIGSELAKLLVETFLTARFASEVDRYVRRLDKIRQLEQGR